MIEEEKALAVPKPRRLVDPAAIRAARRAFCAVCGATEGLVQIQVHHVQTRGAGGPDSPENLVALCAACHQRWHNGEIGEEDVAWPFQVHEPPPLEHVKQLFFGQVERTEEPLWAQAAIIVLLVDGYQMKWNQVSAELGWSPAKLREFRRTFLAFPEPEMRAQDLTFTHHRYASQAPNPWEWIDRAAANQWSTRQLREAIEEAGLSPEAVRDRRRAKAERVVRQAREILAEGDEVADELRSKLSELLAEEEAA